MTQLFIALFGLTAIWFSMVSTNPTLRKLAPLVGLCGQPWWFYFAWESDSWGLGLLVVAYTLVYLKGIKVQWVKSKD